MKKMIYCMFVGTLILMPRLLVALGDCEDCQQSCYSSWPCGGEGGYESMACKKCLKSCGDC